MMVGGNLTWYFDISILTITAPGEASDSPMIVVASGSAQGMQGMLSPHKALGS